MIRDTILQASLHPSQRVGCLQRRKGDQLSRGQNLSMVSGFSMSSVWMAGWAVAAGATHPALCWNQQPACHPHQPASLLLRDFSSTRTLRLRLSMIVEG